jgi:hypothetical protein
MPARSPCRSAVTYATPVRSAPVPTPRPKQLSGAMSLVADSSSAAVTEAATGTTSPLASDCS